MPGRLSTRRAQGVLASRGHALLIALALVLGLMVVVAATGMLIVQQLSATRTERSYEHALQMAEAGANAYVNMLTHGPAPATALNSGLIPPPYIYDNSGGATGSAILTVQEFKREALNTSSAVIPPSSIIHYPIGSPTQGYCAYQTSQPDASSGNVTVVSYGWCNGVYRSVQIQGQLVRLFDWTAVYALNPALALDLTNPAITGGWGAEGLIKIQGSAALSGPTLLAANGITANPSPGWPNVTRFARSLSLPTADQIANEYSQTNQGVEYFRTHNNNGSGIRVLVQNTNTSRVRELPPTTKWVPGLSGTRISLDTTAVTTQDLTNAGMNPSHEVFYGLRIYPGDYYFTDIQSLTNIVNGGGSGSGDGHGGHGGDDNQGPPVPVKIYIRNYADGRQPASDPLDPVMPADPSNPNGGRSAESDVRFWIGNTPGTLSRIYDALVTEDIGNPDGFWMLDANIGSTNSPVSPSAISIKQPVVYAAILAYNRDASKNGYGTIAIDASSTINGSLVGWSIQTHGNNLTVIKGARDPQPSSMGGFLFRISSWKEVQ